MVATRAMNILRNAPLCALSGGRYSAIVRAMLRDLFPRFLLIVALLCTQLGGLTHGISHTLEDQGSQHALSHEKHCDLCAAYAQLGSALSSQVPAFEAIGNFATPVFITPARFISTVFAAYAARGPPCSA